MKKFVSVLLVISMIFLLTACGSEEKGTKGVYEGLGYSVSWSKGFLSPNITLTVIETGSNGYFADGFEFKEQLNQYSVVDDTGNAVLPFSMDKNFKNGKMVYKISPIKESLTDEAITNTIVITDCFGDTAEDIVLAFEVYITCSKEDKLVVAVEYYNLDNAMSGVAVDGVGTYSTAYQFTENGINVAISNPSNDVWNVVDYEKRLFEVGGLYSTQAKIIVPVTAVGQGKGFVYVKNTTKGLVYKLFIGAQAITSADNTVIGYNVMLFGVDSYEEKTTVKDSRGYKEAKETASALGFDFDEIEIPEGLDVESINTIISDSKGGSSTSDDNYKSTYVVGDKGDSTGGTTGGTTGGSTENDKKSDQQFTDKEVKEKFEEALALENKSYVEEDESMKTVDRVSVDNSDYTMIEYKLTKAENTETSDAYIVCKASEVTEEKLISNYDTFKGTGKTYSQEKVNINGLNVTLILADEISAAIFTSGKYIYVYESVGKTMTKNEAVEKLQQYIISK